MPHAEHIRDHGPQPIATILTERGLRPRDLVSASTEQITHKMVQRACKGRRLSPHVMAKVRNALNAASGEMFELHQLFSYSSARPTRRERAQPTTPDPTPQPLGDAP